MNQSLANELDELILETALDTETHVYHIVFVMERGAEELCQESSHGEVEAACCVHSCTASVQVSAPVSRCTAEGPASPRAVRGEQR